MFGSYRGYLHARQERDVWQQLESATRELTSLDLDAVVRRRAVPQRAAVQGRQRLGRPGRGQRQHGLHR
jgi:hypothetical protein